MSKNKDQVLKTIARGAGIVFIGTIISKILTYFFRAITGRMLGPGGYGDLTIGLMVFGFTSSLITLGLPAGVQRFVSYYRSKGNKQKMKGSFLTSIEITLSISIIVAVIIFLGSDVIANFVFHTESVSIVLKVIAIGLPFNLLLINSVNGLIAFKKMKYKVYSRNLIENSSKLLAAIILLTLGYGAAGSAGAFVVGNVLAALSAFYYLEKVSGFFKSKIKPLKNYKEMLSFSLPLTASNILGQLTSWTDIFMLGVFSTSVSVGLYNSALPTASALGITVAAFGSIFLPMITELYSQNKKKEMRETYETVTKWIFALSFPLFVLMVFFAAPGIKLLFGADFLQEKIVIAGLSIPIAAFSLSLLAFGRLANAMVGPTNQMINALGKTKYRIYISGSVGISNAVFNFFLIQEFGVPGAAVGTTLSLVIGAFTSLYFVYKETKIFPFGKSFLKIIFSSLIAGGVVYIILKSMFLIIPVWTLIPGFVAFLTIYLILLLLLKTFEKEDIMIMKAIEKKLGIKIDWLRNIIKRFL